MCGGEGVGPEKIGSNVLTGVTQEGSPSQAMVVLVQVRRPSRRQIRDSHRLRHDADKKWVILCCLEKPRRDGSSRPYPKPTQVVR